MTITITEREAFLSYLEAIGRKLGHDACTAEARAACPVEYAAWREVFIREYGFDPAA